MFEFIEVHRQQKKNMFTKTLTTCRRQLLPIHKWTITKKSVNDSFFSSWSPSMAYWLGFMYADGNVTWNQWKKTYDITLALKCTDYDHVEKFNTAVESTYHLGMQKCSQSAFNSNYCLARTSLSSRQMAEI